MISIGRASRDDDAGIRALLASNPMPGRIRVRFEREPSYFAGCASDDDVLVARDGAAVIGVACRSIRPLYINGAVENIGYLGQLRVDRAYRGQLLTARGYRVMRELHEERPARGYYTTIVDGNAQAEGVLVRRSRGGMPRYRFVERLYTLALNVGRASARPAADGRAEARPTLNLFPAYPPQERIISVPGGSAALVDQRAFKQTVIDGYSPALAIARPLYNAFANIKLPKPHTTLNHAYVTHFRAEDPFALMHAILDEAKNYDHVLFGFTESDPALQIARQFKPVEYISSLYTVAFDDHDDFHERLLARPRALDISAL